MNYIKQAQVLEQRKKQIINELKKAIKTLPENENIKILSDSPRCYTLKVSQLMEHGNLSPKFYSFKHQYEQISDWIESQSVETIIINWDESKRKGILGKFYRSNNSGEPVFKPSQRYSKLHP